MFGWLKRKNNRTLSQRDELRPASKEFLGGAYRLHRTEDVEKYTALAAAAFPEFAKRITCFGSSWLGCQFATDEERIVGGERQVLLLEPGTGEVLQIPAGFDTFHTGELIAHPDAVAARSFFDQWLSADGTAPLYDQCVAYQRPLFLGGADEITNLHLTDFEVYWAITAQILEQVRGLPVGTRIKSVSITE